MNGNRIDRNRFLGSGSSRRWSWRMSITAAFVNLMVGLFCLWPVAVYADGPTFYLTRIFGMASDDTYGVAVGDMNGDGALDIVAGNSGEQNAVYLNDGTGYFNWPGAVQKFGTGADSTNSVAIGDMNGDGALDIVVGNYREQNVVYLNDGNGHFDWPGAARDFGPGSEDTYSVAVGDVNGDGALDIVTGNSGQDVVYLNNGLGFFPDTGAYTRTLGMRSSRTNSVALGDLDSDGDLDAVAGNYLQSYAYLNDGEGNFTVERAVGGNSSYAMSMALGDVDGDGDLDVVAGNGGQNYVYLNDGHGNFITGSTFAGSNTNGVAVGDVDSDGDLDILAGNGSIYGGEENIIALNDGTGNFTTGPTFDARWDITCSVAIRDVDNDGDLDLIVGNMGLGIISLNDGSGAFADKNDLGLGDDATYAVAVGDVDGDGDLDIAVGNKGQQNVVYFNDGMGHFPYGRNFGTGHDGTENIAMADVDNDGDLDLVVGNTEVVYLENGADFVYLNDGTGDFSAKSPFGTGYDHTFGVATGDLDGDGDLDIVSGNGELAGSREPDAIYWNDGTGAFSETLGFGSGTDRTNSVALGDLEGDGDLDIVVGNWGKSFAYLNDGTGYFYSGPITCSVTMNVRCFGDDWRNTESVALGDVDGDGDLDIVAGNEDGQNFIHLNDGAGNFTINRPYGTGWDRTYSVALGDVDGDGDLDIAVGNRDQDVVYLNDGAGNFPTGREFGTGADVTAAVAMGDLNGDGTLDIVSGNRGWYTGKEQNMIYLNRSRQPERLPNNPPFVVVNRPLFTDNANFLSSPETLDAQSIPIPYTLFDAESDPVGYVAASYSLDGGGSWSPAVAANTITTNLSTRLPGHYASGDAFPLTVPDESYVTSALVVAGALPIEDIDVWLSITHTRDSDLDVYLGSPDGSWVPLFTDVGGSGDGFFGTVLDDEAAISITTGTAPFAGAYRPEGRLANLDGQMANGTWILWIADDFAGESGAILSWGITLKAGDGDHVFVWDTFASGVFGQSDQVVFRLDAYPQLPYSGIAGSYDYIHGTSGPRQWAYGAATTFPFSLRGTQVRVLSDTLPASNALVYRLSADQTTMGALISDSAGHPFRTDAQGYLQGRGHLTPGDRLFAMLPITWTGTYTLYYTSGAPTFVGLDTYTVTASGIQTLTISAAHPLILFNLDVSLEWDAHNDAAYLEQLQANLARASEYLYDFTDGQMALGHVNVFQNADEWGFSHVVVNANNHLRPFAAQGGVVITDTVDPEHADIHYSPGQVSMGSTWNRYGNPGQSLGDDWPLILAHELSHYLLFHDDTYLGLDDAGFLIPVTTCLGSAMGDLYNDPTATEFIADEGHWQSACAQTLAERTLGRNEWETMRLWYPDLANPVTTLAGPTLMPFDFTSVQVYAPYTPTATLLDPTFYADYQGGGSSSSEARAYLFSTATGGDYVVNLGSSFGGQNRVLARGARPDDRLCVFDRPRAQFGCEIIALGDDRLSLRQDEAWNPVVQFTPINTVTLLISVTNSTPIASPILARLFPEMGYAAAPITLPLIGDSYSGMFTLEYPTLAGHVQVWVDEPAAETQSRRETVVAFNVGGNPGFSRGGGGFSRGGGGFSRGGGGFSRGGGGFSRGGGAPLISPDGQLIFFTENPEAFITGTLFTIQAMAGVPTLPPGRTLVGQGYSLVASPGAVLPPGSVSLQYLSNDVLVAGAQESQLALYFWDGSAWIALDATLDDYFNLATAPSQGPGMYALLASIQIPLTGPGWNLFAYPVAETRPVTAALVAISGFYTTVYGYKPTDPADPWKVLDITAPEWVNDLYTLEFGKGYWINVSQSITLHLASGTQAANSKAPAQTPDPPATFYGAVLSRPGFTPAAGAPVTAWIDGHFCGQGRTLEVNGDIVYTLNVFADGLGYTGCGAPGRTVRFHMGERTMQPVVAWDNAQLWEIPLRVAASVYLPLVVKEH